MIYCYVGVDHIIIVFTSGFTYYMVDTWNGDDMLSVWSDDDNVIIVNVGVLLLFLGGWYVSGVMFMMSQSVSNYK